MKKKHPFYNVFMLLLFWGLGGCFQLYPQKVSTTFKSKINDVEVEIRFCNLEISNAWKLANIKFTLLYQFNINEKGEVINIKKIRNDFINEEAVKSCISNWKIIGFPEQPLYIASFEWNHGKGWVRQEVSSKDYRQIITMENVRVEVQMRKGKP